MATSARAALRQSGADAVMIGRGAYGQPWVAAAIQADLDGTAAAPEPDRAERLDIVLTHFRDSLDFYGDRLGLKIFRKHLGWYIERAPWPDTVEVRREAKARLCRMENPADVEAGLTELWLRAA